MPNNSTSSLAWQDWSPEEEALLISQIDDGLNYNDVAKQLPGRTAISCRAHYYPRLHWQKVLKDQGNTEKDLTKECEEHIEDEVTQDLEEDIDDAMNHLERGIKNAFIHDSKDDIKDDPSLGPAEIVPKPTLS